VYILQLKLKHSLKLKSYDQFCSTAYNILLQDCVYMWRGQVWYGGWEVCDVFGFYLREALQSQNNTENISCNKSL